MRQLKLSEHERLTIITALCVTMITATNKRHAGTHMRLAKKILLSLYNKKEGSLKPPSN